MAPRLAVALLAAASLLIAAAAADLVTCAQQCKTIATQGTATASLAPTTATIRFSVIGRGASAAEAFSNSDLGLATNVSHATFVAVSLSEVFNFSTSPPTSMGFEATRTFKIETDPASVSANVDAIVIATTSASAPSTAVTLQSVSFGVRPQERAAAYQQQLAVATMDARSRAMAIASGTAQALGPAITVSEQSNELPQPPPMPFMALAAPMAPSSVDNFESSDIKIRADVVASFQLMDAAPTATMPRPVRRLL